jgi:imidazolonepropionase-like amidohydrolase
MKTKYLHGDTSAVASFGQFLCPPANHAQTSTGLHNFSHKNRRRCNASENTPICYTDLTFMKLHRIHLLAFALCLATHAPAQTAAPLAIVDVNVVDVVKGETRARQTVLIDNGRIADAGSSDAVAIPADAIRIPGQGRYLIPGLWDMHIHLRSDERKPDIPLVEENAALLGLFLPNGVVGVREMGGDLADHVLRWRDEIRSGKRTGPRILTAGRKIDREPPAWDGSLGVTTPEAAREAVRQVKQSGADFVKVYFSIVSPEVLGAVVDEAHKNNLKVIGHKAYNLSIQAMLDIGQDGIEHAQYLLAAKRDDYEQYGHEMAARRGTPLAMDSAEQNARLLHMEDAKEEARVYQAMAAKQVWVTPTLAVVTRLHQDLGVRDFESDDRKRFVFPAVWESWDPKLGRRTPLQGRNRELAAEVDKRSQQAVVAAHKAGVPMVAGTDCGVDNNYMFPGWSIHEELESLVKAGLTPAEALRMATIDAARWRGETATEGSVEKGKTADLVLLRSNPLEAIRHTREIESVVAGGKYYSRPDLDAMLRHAEDLASGARGRQPPR